MILNLIRNSFNISKVSHLPKFFIAAICLLASLEGLGENLELAKGNSLLEEGRRQVELRNYFEAQPHLEAAHNIFKEEDAFDHQVEAMFLLDEVYDMTIQQDLRKENIESCIDLVTQNLSPLSPLAFKSQFLMVDHYLESRRSVEARKLLDHLLPDLEAIEDSLNLSRYFLLSGRCFQKQWAFSQANESYLLAYSFAPTNANGSHQQIVKVLFRLITFNIESSQLEKAEEYLDQLQDQINSIPNLTSQDSMDLARCFFLRGRRAWRAGNYGKKLEYCEQSLLLYHQISIAHREDLGTTLSWIAGAYAWLGKRDLGFKAFEESQHYLKSPTNKVMALTYHNGVVIRLFFRGFADPHRTEQDLQLAFQLEREWKLNPYFALNMASSEKIRSGNLVEGLRYAKMSLATFDTEDDWELHSKVHRGYAHEKVGEAFFAAQEYDSAAIYNHWAILDHSTDFNSTNWRKNPDETNSFSNSRVLELINRKASCFLKLAEIHEEKRREYLELAYQSFQSASRVSDKFRTIYTSAESKLNMSKRTKVTHQGLVSTAYKLFEMTNDTVYLIEAFRTSESARGLLLLESQSSVFARKNGGVPDSILMKEQYLKGELAFYQSALFDENTYGESRDSNHISFLKMNVFSLQDKLESWKDSISMIYPGYSLSGAYHREINPNQVIDSILEPREALIEYFIGESDLFTFLITKEGFEVFRTPIPEDFEVNVGRFIESISSLKYVQDSVQAGFSKYTSTAIWLFELLLDPVLGGEFEAEQLIVVRDHILSKVPFEALLIDHPSRQLDYLSLPYLLRKYPIRYAHSAKSLLELKKIDDSDTELNCLAMAPGYNSKGLSRGDLGSLRGSEGQLEGAHKEVAALSEIGVEGDFYFGDSATERKFKTLAPKYNLLHLAMHGKSDKNEPSKSNLKFTEIEEDSTEDHILHAIELGSIPFDAKLVVLSACESGIGKFADGEGELSLGRDFMANGANAVVMTLWRVEDKASSTLMQTFYRELTSGIPTGMALHNAKLDFLKSADSRSAHPYFWAGYISMGNSAALFQSRTNWSAIVFWGLVALCLLVGIRWWAIKRKARTKI